MSTKSKYGSWNVDGALQLARQLVDNHCCEEAVDIVGLAMELGVARVEPADISIDGYLGRGGDGQLLIKYKSSSSRSRSRFTIAHELGHLLLYRSSEVDVPECAARGRNRSTDEELAANRVASELLMPKGAILSRLRRLGPSWDLVRGISQQFDVSITAASRRITEISPVPIVIFWATVENEEPTLIRHFRCATSVAHRFLFCRPPRHEAQSIVDAVTLGAHYCPRAQIDGAECLLQWEAMRVEKLNGVQHWLLCWELARR